MSLKDKGGTKLSHNKRSTTRYNSFFYNKYQLVMITIITTSTLASLMLLSNAGPSVADSMPNDNKCYTLNEAAIAALNVAMPYSGVAEYAGVIYKQPNGCHAFTPPETKCKEDGFEVHAKFKGMIAGIYHTHHGGSYVAEKFTARDVKTKRWYTVPSFVGDVMTHKIRKYTTTRARQQAGRQIT